MNVPTKHQVIRDEGGAPLFVLVPYQEYIESDMGIDDDEVTIPWDVSKALRAGKNPVRAWREHLGLTQAEAAERLDITQSGYSQFEIPDKQHRRGTLKKIATAFGIDVAQLIF